MDRGELQQIARMRKKEARKLLRSGFYSGAYYLCGYAIECAIKSCIAKRTKRYDFPDKDAVNQSYSHKLEQLIEIAGLKIELDNEISRNNNFGDNWSTMKDWNVESRYKVHSKDDATDMYNALVARYDGVYRWIIKYW